MDGTMCEGTGCTMKSSCYRYNAEPNPFRQSYFMEVPLKLQVKASCSGLTQEGSHNPIVAECEEYWEYPKKSNEK
jgi:hypothetical protein